MSENHYTLPLTERERKLVKASVEASSFNAIMEYRNESLSAEYEAIYDKLRALEPIGTGGTTEGNG